MELAALEVQMAPMDQHWEIVFSCARVLLSHSWRNDAGDLLTLGDQVAFTDDTIFGGRRNNCLCHRKWNCCLQRNNRLSRDHH